MKKARIIASLLCIMMVVCALPMMQASAAYEIPVAGTEFPALMPANLGPAMAAMRNTLDGTNVYISAYPKIVSDNWYPSNLDFTDPAMASNPYLTNLNNSVTFGEDGARFPAEGGKMRYFPGAANPIYLSNLPSAEAKEAEAAEKTALATEKKALAETADEETKAALLAEATTLETEATALKKTAKSYRDYATYWSPGGENNGYPTYNFKLDANGSLTAWLAVLYSYNVAHIDVTPDGVTIHSATGNGSGLNDDTLVTYTEEGKTYKPGTEWNDVLVKHGDTKAPYQVWMKKATDSTFVKIAEAKFLANVDGTGNSGFNVGFGKDYTNTKKGLTFIGTNANVGYASGLVHSRNPIYNSIEDITGGIVASTHAFDFDSEYHGTYKRDGWTSYSENVTFTDENGMYLPANADGSATNWHYSGHNGRWSPFSYGAASGGFLPSSVYLKIKGALTVQLRAKGSSQRMVQLVFDANSGKMPDGSGGTSNELNYHDEWTEYLIVPKTASETAGYTLYAKGEKSTNGVWVRVADKNSYIVGAEDTTGINITGKGGYVKAIRILRPGVTDAEITPANANYKWFGDEMDEALKYNNLSQSGYAYADGIVSYESAGQFNVGYAPIPVGGYAEFRTRAKNRQEIFFIDGEEGITINFAKDYHTITGGNGFMSDSNCTWRTWRVVRTENGYNIYSKVDTDSGWLVVGENAIKAFAGMADGSSFKFHSDATEGTDAYMDYLRIYGPAPTNTLTITDGYGTKVLKNGDKIGYGGAVRPIITGVESGKLLVVCYKGNDMLKASVYDVEDLTETTFVSAHIGGCDTAKFFLWDGFSKMNSLTNPLVAGYQE